MTITSTAINKEFDGDSLIAGNPNTIPFNVQTTGDVAVYYNGDQVAVLATDYDINLIPPNYATAQFVPTSTLIAKLDPGTKVIVRYNLDYKQSYTLLASNALNEKLLELTFDRVVMYVRQVFDSIGRTVLASPGAPNSNITLPDFEQGKALIWGADNSTLINGATADEIAAASTYAANALASANASAASATAASGHSDKAQQWAEEAEDTEVETGKFSALHWSAKAEAFAASVNPSIYVSQDSETGSLDTPAGTTAQRTGVPTAGFMRFNTDLSEMEYYDGSLWRGFIDPGVICYFARQSPSAGWLKLNGTTIGDATSGGTALASARAEALFTLLWTHFANTELPIQDSAGSPTTRGASAANDFAAHKRMPLPDDRGQFSRAWDDGAGVDTGRVFGALQADELKSHSHPLGGVVLVGGSQVQTGGSGTNNLGGSTSSVTGGTETRPKNRAYGWFIKI